MRSQSVKPPATLHDRLKMSIGKFPSGGLDLSVDSGAKFAALLRAEYEADQLAINEAGAEGTGRRAEDP